MSEYRVLATLLRIGSDATPGELATLLKLSVTSITETAAALVTHGYLERRRGVQDRRLVHLVLTPSGSEALTSADAALSRYIVKLWEPLDEDQRRVIADSSMQIDCIFKQGLDMDRRAFVSSYLDTFVYSLDLFRETCTRFGFSIGEYRCLFELVSQAQPRSMKQISEALLIKGNSLTPIATSLCKKSLIERYESEHDKCSFMLRATEEGTARLNSTLRELNEAFATDAYPTDEHSPICQRGCESQNDMFRTACPLMHGPLDHDGGRRLPRPVPAARLVLRAMG